MESGISMNRVIAELARGRITRREAVKLLMASGAAAALWPRLGRADGTVGGIPLARPDQPVTLPLFQKPIESGLKPESDGGNFYVFNYDEYVDPKLMEDSARSTTSRSC